MLDLWLIRHAQSLGNQPGIRVDSDLSPEGEAQARALRDDLRGEEFDAVLSSPLYPARRTAELALPKEKLVIEPRLRDLVVPGQTLIDVTRLDAEGMRELAARTRQEPERENGREFIGRIRAWIDGLPREGRIVAFTHFAVMRESLRMIQRRPAPRWIDFCEIQRVAVNR